MLVNVKFFKKIFSTAILFIVTTNLSAIEKNQIINWAVSKEIKFPIEEALINTQKTT